MITFEFTDEERQTLSQVLKVKLAEMEIEIQHTDHREYRELLKHRREVLKGMLLKAMKSVTTEVPVS